MSTRRQKHRRPRVQPVAAPQVPKELAPPQSPPPSPPAEPTVIPYARSDEDFRFLSGLNADMADHRDGVALDAPALQTVHEAYFNELFAIYVKCDGDLHQICERADLFPGAVMEWLEQPHVRAAIARYCAHREAASRLKAIGAYHAAIDSLTVAAENAGRDIRDPARSAVERRHAATALARAAKNLADFIKPRSPQPQPRIVAAAPRDNPAVNREPAPELNAARQDANPVDSPECNSSGSFSSASAPAGSPANSPSGAALASSATSSSASSAPSWEASSSASSASRVIPS